MSNRRGMQSSSIAGYDRLAPWYRSCERMAFGWALDRARTVLLGELRTASNVLILGDGDGRFLRQLLAANFDCRVTSIDYSGGMIARQRSRVLTVGGTSRVQWVQADVREVQPPSTDYDLIVTAFFLDCFTSEQIDQLIPRLGTWLVPGGSWYYVDFQMPVAGSWRRGRARLLLGAMHRFFRWQTGLPTRELADADAVLRQNGWRCCRRVDSNLGMITSRLYARRALSNGISGSSPR